jgi:polysaccharide export outer membrane protein
VIRVEIRAVTSATPDINGLFRVGEDGFIEMKLINRRLVNGLSTKQAENLIAKAFSKWLKRPQVSINIVLGASNRERIAHGKVANVFRDTLLGPSKDNLLVGLGSSDGLKVHSVVRLLHVGQQIVTAEVADLDSTYAICIVRDGNGKVRTSDDAQIETGYYRKKANP